MMLRRGCSLATIFLLSLLVLSPASGAEKTSWPEAFSKLTPTTVQDLKAIQTHVSQVVARVTPFTVGLRIGPNQGSGVIVTKDGYILTAGHVSGKDGQKVDILLHDGRRVKGVTLGAHVGDDSGLVKITDPGDWPHAEMANSAQLKRGDWCLSLGHPGGYQSGRLPVVRLGRVLDVTKKLIRTDCTLVGGDSGGPLFDMAGKVIGIHSRIGGSITYNIHVPIDSYRDRWDDLVASKIMGSDGLPPWLQGFGKSPAYLGVQFDPEATPIRVTGITPDSPAAKAGLRIDDVLLKVDQQRLDSAADLRRALERRRPNSQITIQFRRGDETRTATITLAKRPA